MKLLVSILMLMIPCYGVECVTFGCPVSIGETEYVVSIVEDTVQDKTETTSEYLTEEDSEMVSDVISETSVSFDFQEQSDVLVASAAGVGGSNVSFIASVENTTGEIQGVPIQNVFEEKANNISGDIDKSDINQIEQSVSLSEDDVVGITTPQAIILLQDEESYYPLTTTTCDENVDPRANGTNFGGGAIGVGGTGVSGINGKDEWQTLILDGSKNLNINKRYLTVLYSNNTYYWDESTAIPLISFDVGTLIYNGVTLDDTFELEHGLDYSEFIYGVTFPTLDPLYEYRLELNNGAVMLWAKLPNEVPEPSMISLVLVSSLLTFRRTRV